MILGLDAETLTALLIALALSTVDCVAPRHRNNLNKSIKINRLRQCALIWKVSVIDGGTPFGWYCGKTSQ